MHPEVSTEGDGSSHLAVASDRDSGLAVLYVPPAQRLHLMLEPLGMSSAHAQWYDPRTGAELEGGELTVTGEQVLDTPTGSGADDWVLVFRGNT